MRVAIPHSLPRDEVRRRLRAHSGEIGQHIPGRVADVATSWRSEDQMEISVAALGARVDGDITIEDSQVVFQVRLPPALTFVEPLVAGAIADKGRKLLSDR
ncbi:hypothetical protein EYB45_04440 [Erythrobacteraceae bacterium CFH 75059]|uniref:polyhydroxyalkanoic acid system family protein n=1 Tax=Qipengyuania thermophila TaxID=2509361 RepID=UPI0010216CC3|nr:polyhydroxyalkanoic acid system family protein [Qipengyuania thermophila]TCD04803.1 hypothetical protein EYB45_04440 [Erythrobacteraceae bacterium CFH 75059]